MLGVAPENIRGLIYGIDPGSHRHLWPSFLGADPWSDGSAKLESAYSDRNG
jgi:hypothetical protein